MRVGPCRYCSGMAGIPRKSVLVRTWFGDDSAWGSLVREVLTPSKEGFLAYTTVVNDPEFEGLSPEALKAKHPGGAIVSFLADETTLTDPERPILAVWVLPPQDYHRGNYQPFRVVPDQLASVDTNINDANLDWRDFADHVDADGIYRGHADAKESDFELSVRHIMADRLAHLTPGLTESIRIAESPDEGAGIAVISCADDPPLSASSWPRCGPIPRRCLGIGWPPSTLSMPATIEPTTSPRSWKRSVSMRPPSELSWRR